MTLSLYGDQFAQATDRARRVGQGATDFAMDRARTFDAGGALKTAAGGLFDLFTKTAGKKINDLRGSMVGGGRLGGGYGEQDESDVLTQMGGDLNSKIASLALNAEGMNQDNTRMMLDAGGQHEQQYLDLMTGGMDREQAARNAKANRKSSLWGSLAGLAGSVLGGPAGGYLGKKLFG